AVSCSYTCWFPLGMSTMTTTAIVSPSSRSRLCRGGWSGGCVASVPPGRDEGGVLGGAVLPGEVPRVDDVELAVRQPLMEELGVHRRHGTVPAAGDDLHRGLHLREQITQGRELGGGGARVPHRFDEAVALVGRQVVLPDWVWQRVPLDTAQYLGDDLPRVSGAEAVEVGCVDPVIQRRAQLQRDCRTPASDHQAAQPARMPRRGEQTGRGADVRADDVRVLEAERVSDLDDELTHCPRGQQRVAALRVPETWQVDGHQVRVLAEPGPHWLEGEQALGPGVQQQGGI